MSDSEALFDIAPPALIYPYPCSLSWHEMRCRECHKVRSLNGGGVAGEFQYVICQACFHDHDEVGRRARSGGWSGRDVILGVAP